MYNFIDDIIELALNQPLVSVLLLIVYGLQNFM